jgi:hypothetical protein
MVANLVERKAVLWAVAKDTQWAVHLEQKTRELLSASSMASQKAEPKADELVALSVALLEIRVEF